MKKIYLPVTAFLIIVGLYGCSKRTHPSKTADNSIIILNKKSSDSENNSIKNSLPEKVDSVATVEKKPVENSKPKAVFPKVIAVNDSAARKSIDGRLYYDVMGHRYWKNFKDGKYYLFDKSMYNNPAFKPQTP